MYKKYIKKSIRFSAKEKIKNLLKRKDPDYFKPDGSQIYFGYQGQGKTLSMVKHALEIKKKYPKAIVVSNLNLKDIEYIHFSTFQELTHLFATVKNGKYGVIYIIDEIHNYFHSHDSRSIPLWIVQVFSQQRKNRMLVLGSAQLWEDVTKAIRDQIENLISCKKVFGVIINQVLDPRQVQIHYGEKKIKVKKFGFFIPSEKLFNRYDTYQIIDSGRSIFGNIDPVIINQQTAQKK